MALTPFITDPFFNTFLTTFPHDEFSHLFDNGPSKSRALSAQLPSAAVDVKETPDALHFVADLPGLKKEEVSVKVDGQVLSISGERTRETKQEGDTWHRVERSSGKFLRQFQLPKNTDLEKNSATSANGVLTVTVPKITPEEQKPKTIEINVTESA